MTHRALPFLPSILKWGVMPVILTQNQCAETQGVNLPALWDRASMIKSWSGATRTWERSLESWEWKLPQILLNPWSSLPLVAWQSCILPPPGTDEFSLLPDSHASVWALRPLLTPSLYSFHQIPSLLCLLKYKAEHNSLSEGEETSNPSLDPGYTLRFPKLAPSLSPFLQSSLWNPLEPNHRSLYKMTIIPHHATQSALGSAVAPKLPKPMHSLWFPFYSILCATE